MVFIGTGKNPTESNTHPRNEDCNTIKWIELLEEPPSVQDPDNAVQQPTFWDTGASTSTDTEFKARKHSASQAPAYKAEGNISSSGGGGTPPHRVGAPASARHAASAPR